MLATTWGAAIKNYGEYLNRRGREAVMTFRGAAWRRPVHIPSVEWKEACSLADFTALVETYPHDTVLVPLLRACLDAHWENADPKLESEAYRLALFIAATEIPKRSAQRERARARRSVQRSLERARLPLSHGRAWKRAGITAALSHQRVQFAVGQGGFHAGVVTQLGKEPAEWEAAIRGDALTGGDFVYVYDCGSEPAERVRNAVKAFVKSRGRKRLQMLFLSHLDRDHMAGVTTLLAARSGVEVDTIVLPFLDDIDRLIAFGRTARIVASDAVERFHREMVLDPIGSLQRFRPRQIILVAAEDDESLPERGPAAPPGGSDGSIRWETISSFDGGSVDVGVTDSGAALMRHGQFLLSISGKGAWRLRPYVRRAAREDREAFMTAIESALEWPRDSFRAKVEDPKTRRLLVTKHRSAIARAYKWAFGDKNETSPSLYSGPAFPQNCGAVFTGLPVHEEAKIGWLGTGDAYLADPPRIEEFEQFYRADLNWVTTFVLPHHGSIHNSDPHRLVSEADTWVVNAQPNHSGWKHPDPALATAIKRRGMRFKHVNGIAKSTYAEKMVVFTYSEQP